MIIRQIQRYPTTFVKNDNLTSKKNASFKGDVRNRASEALKTIVFQIDRSPRLFVQKSSEMVRLKAHDTGFAFL